MLSDAQIKRLTVRLAVGPRALISRVEARFLIPGRDAEVDAICRRLPFRTVGEDGQPLYEYQHVLEALPLQFPPGGEPKETPVPRASASPRPSRVAREAL